MELSFQGGESVHNCLPLLFFSNRKQDGFVMLFQSGTLNSRKGPAGFFFLLKTHGICNNSSVIDVGCNIQNPRWEGGGGGGGNQCI